MPNKSKPAKSKAPAETKAASVASVQATGKAVLAQLEEQVHKLSNLAEEYLDQGLLGHYEEAMQMRDGAEKTLQDMRKKLGLAPTPVISSVATKPAAAASAPPAPVSEQPRARPKDSQPAEAPLDAKSASVAQANSSCTCGAAPVADALFCHRCGARTGQAGDASASPKDSGGAPVPKGESEEEKWSAPVGQGQTASPLMPRYRWQPAPSGSGALLEIFGPGSAGGSSSSDSKAADPADAAEVDISETAVRCSWSKSGWLLTLPAGFRIDLSQCSVRRRRTGLMQLSIAPGPPATPEAAAAKLRAELCGKEGCGWMDGFLAGAEADLVRARLLELWHGGQFEPGEVEGGRKARVRSDEYMYAEENDPVLSIFTRRLDRLVLAMAKEVPELRGVWLMRGRPMAAVYAGAGSRYTPHFDAVGGDNGRKITCILYLNPFWRKGDGAELQIYPEAKDLRPSGPCVEVDPLHGRLACFLCNSRNLHGVNPVADQPGVEPRLAVSCWYYDSEGGAFDREDENDSKRPRDRPTS